MSKRVKITELRDLVGQALARQRRLADQLRIESAIHAGNTPANPQVRALIERLEAKADVLEDVARALRGDTVQLKILAEDH